MTWAEVKAEAGRLGIPLRGAEAFYSQRNGAKSRGIGFEFTLADWWAWWQEGGRWERRGQGKDGLVMARCGDLGPYRRDNVECLTGSQNFRDGLKARGRVDRVKPEPIPNKELQVIAAKLRAKRLASGMSQDKVAAAAGITQAVLSKLEAGLRMPRIDTLLRVVTALGGEVVLAPLEADGP